MQYSKHAKKRTQQRGIPASIVNMVIEYGEPESAPGNAYRYEVSKSVIPRLQKRVKSLLHEIEQLKGKVVVVSKDGIILTTYTKERDS